MEELFLSFGWKKIAVISIIFLIILVSIIFFGSGISPKTTSNNAISPTSVPRSTDISNPKPTTIPPARATYQSQTYSVSYPSVWQPQTAQVLGGGTFSHFIGGQISKGEIFPRVDIKATPITSATKSIQDAISDLSILNLMLDTTVLDGQEVTRLSGVMPFNFSTTAGNKKVFKAFLFLDKDNTRYTIDYAYYADENQDISKQIVYQIIDSYQFK
ncbi:MAG TPA: hypothetical protein VG965_02660 [Patescibacteria group bacterium]|nr:hypothetical protein [Patescibacteria group bacterium]